ncbi:MAG: hypothetical protein H0W52_16500 [Rubrobacteraceae bacterium]|nr:hypothetical protein [Rubrobacteraceae bacterium]
MRAAVNPDADKPQRTAAVEVALRLATMEGSMNEGERDRLRRAVERLMIGQREALGVIDREVEDQESSAQETLAEVQDILSGAYEDARTILGGEEGGA